MLVAIDSNSCNVSDTTYRYVIARTNKAPTDFADVKDPNLPCDSLTYDFTNLSTAPPGLPFKPTSFVWDFGDNSPELTGWAGTRAACVSKSRDVYRKLVYGRHVVLQLSGYGQQDPAGVARGEGAVPYPVNGLCALYGDIQQYVAGRAAVHLEFRRSVLRRRIPAPFEPDPCLSKTRERIRSVCSRSIRPPAISGIRPRRRLL